jgi:hypothetical protein
MSAQCCHPERSRGICGSCEGEESSRSSPSLAKPRERQRNFKRSVVPTAAKHRRDLLFRQPQWCRTHSEVSPSGNRKPEGRSNRSPGRESWVSCGTNASPVGTAAVCVVPGGTRNCDYTFSQHSRAGLRLFRAPRFCSRNQTSPKGGTTVAQHGAAGGMLGTL